MSKILKRIIIFTDMSKCSALLLFACVKKIICNLLKKKEIKIKKMS